MKLVIAEKPSVGMMLARVLNAKTKHDGYMEGKDYLVSWCYGHLVELATPEQYDPKLRQWRMEDLPLMPDAWHYVPTQNGTKQLNLLKKLMKRSDVKSLVCATDAGREGELIFRQAVDYCGCKKPVERLWVSSLEDHAIQEGFAHLRPASDYDALFRAAQCRSRADWLVGINATRKYSTLCHKPMRVGRVQSPTLAMLVQRAEEIENFVPTPYDTIRLTNEDGLNAVSGDLKEAAETERILSLCSNASATITKVERKEHTVKPPVLLDLTSLQRLANRTYGYSAKDTLDFAQKLYEKKLLSYPRTDSCYITADMVDSVGNLVFSVRNALNLEGSVEKPDTQRIADDSKVSDHYGLLPTIGVTNSVLEELETPLRNVLELVMRRLLCATAQPQIVAETCITVDCGGVIFTQKGKVVLEQGWKVWEKPDPKEKKEAVIPDFSEGQTFGVVTAARESHTTTPPKPYTEDTLLRAMEQAAHKDFDKEVERSGLGTSATRAGIIEKLLHYGYAERKKREILPTEEGRSLIRLLPNILTTPSMTAEWENRLLEIERGKTDAEVFLSDIRGLVEELVQSEADSELVKELCGSDKPVIGTCPRCGADIVEDKGGYFCTRHECKWALWRNSGYLAKAGITLDADIVKSLLETGKAHVTGVSYADSHEGDLLLVELGNKYPSYKYKASDNLKRK